MYKYVNKMTPDVFDNFFSCISDIHQYDTRNAAMKLLYITFRGTTRGQNLSDTVVLVFGISSLKTLIQIVQLAHLKHILVNYFLPLMGKRDFVRFGFKMSSGRISYIAQYPSGPFY